MLVQVITKPGLRSNMEWFVKVYISVIWFSCFIIHSRGQNCDDSNLDITHVTERTVTLILPDEAAIIYITPYPCTDSPPGVNYGCHCDEDYQLDHKQDVQGSESLYTVDYLFSGRYYKFEVSNSSDIKIACGGTYTVPKQPSAFMFDEEASPNPKVDAIGVKVRVPIVLDDAPCDPERHIEISNRFIWIAESVRGNITSYADSTAFFNFSIDGFDPGKEYTLSIQTTSGDMSSDVYEYEEEGGTFKTAIHSVKNVYVEEVLNVLYWNTVEIFPHEGYLVIWNTTVPSDKDGYEVQSMFRPFRDLNDLYPGHNYSLTVETYFPGYKQQDPKELIFHRIAPIKPAFDVLVLNTVRIRVSWTVTGHLDFIKYQINNGTEEQVSVSQGHVDITEGLQPNGYYYIRLWGVAGVSATPDDLVIVQMYSAEVGNLTIDNKTDSTISLTWTNPPDNAVDTDLNHYKVQLWNSGECSRTILMNNTELPQINDIAGLCGSVYYDSFTGSPVILTLYDMETCTNYTVTVIPINTAGNGIETSTMTETHISGPTEPVEISVNTQTASEISIMWNKPEPLRCPMSSRVTLTYFVCENGGIVTINTTLKDTYEYSFTGLQPFTDHNIVIGVFNVGGSTETMKAVKTLSSEPGPPRRLSYTDVSHNSANINWDPVDKCEENGIMIGYRLQVCSSDKLDNNKESCNEFAIQDTTSFQLTGLDPYHAHTCTLRAVNEGFQGSPIQQSFDTIMFYPEAPTINADASCDGFQITISINKLNGPLQTCELEIRKEGSQNKDTWSCYQDECQQYGDPTDQLTITQEHFDGTIDLYPGDAYIIECIMKNTEFESKKAVNSMLVNSCSGSSDVGLAVGLSLGFCFIGAAIVGVVICKRKRLGPFGMDADSGENGDENGNTKGYENYGMSDYEQVNRGGPNDNDCFDKRTYVNSQENENTDDLNHYHEIQCNVPGIDTNDDHETTAATNTYEKLGGFTERHVYN